MKNEVLEIKNVNLEELQKEYLSYIDVKDKTIETYNIAIRQFVKFLNEKEVSIPTREHVLQFKEYLKENHSVSTVNSYLIALRNFFSFLEYNGIYKNITKNVKGLKDNDLHKRDALTTEQCQRVIAECKDIREKSIILLTLTCGLRANEIVNIKLEDFKEENGKCMLYVLGKGRDYKQDCVVVEDEVLNIIKEYISQYGITDYLFVSTSRNNTGNQITTKCLRELVNKIFERASVKSNKITLHSLRHSFATIAIQSGEDLRDVSKAMRHKSVVVTERYLHDLDMANNKCSSKVLQSVLA